MIKITGTNQRNVRECTAPFEYTEGGELKVEEIKVRYFSQTVGEMKEERNGRRQIAVAAPKKGAKKTEQEDSFPWVSNKLAEQLESLPDIAGKDGKPMKITVENLDLISVNNLYAIEIAISRDLVPKSLQSS